MNNDNEITLGQLFRVVKKSFKRAIIYILITLIVATAALLTLRSFVSTRAYASALSFATADENALSVMNRNKSNVVNLALTKNDKDLSLQDIITENLTVSAIVPGNLENTEDFVPTTFVISLKSTSEIKLSGNEYKSIVDAVTNEYMNLFAASTLPSSVIDNYSMPEENSDIEYFQIADELLDNTNLFYSTLTSYLSANSELSSYRNVNNGKTPQDILNELGALNEKIESLQTMIIIERHEKGNLENVIDTLLNNATAKEASYTQQLESAKEAISNFPNFTIVVDGSTPVDASAQAMYDAYLSLQQDVKTYTELASQMTERKTTLTYYQTLLGSTPATDNSTIQGQLTSYNDSLSGIIKDYRTIASEYNESAYLTSKAKVVNPAHSYTDSFIDVTLIGIVLVAVALIAYLAAFSQTYSAIKKNNFGSLSVKNDDNLKREQE